MRSRIVNIAALSIAAVPLFAQHANRNPVLDAYLARLGRALDAGSSVRIRYAAVEDGMAADLANKVAFPFDARASEAGEPIAVADGVFVPVRLLRDTASEPELAAALAHGIAHVSLGHPARLEARRRMGERAPGARPEHPDTAELLLFARGLEIEADLLAVRLMAAAGYDPAALVGYVRKAPERESAPSPEARVKVIEEVVRSLPRRKYTASTGQFERMRTAVGRPSGPRGPSRARPKVYTPLVNGPGTGL